MMDWEELQTALGTQRGAAFLLKNETCFECFLVKKAGKSSKAGAKRLGEPPLLNLLTGK